MILFLGIPKRPNEPAEDVKSYFRHLVATYHSLTPDEKKKNEDLAAKIDKHIQNPEAVPLDWDYLFELELLILRLMPDQMIERKKWVIRERFQEAVGEQDFRDYQQSGPPLKDEPKGALVADLGIILDDLFWRHKLRTLWDSQWKHLVIGIAIGFACVAAASLAVVATWGLFASSVETTVLKAVLALAAVALAGMTGSLISLLQRLQSVPNDQKRTVNLIGIANGKALVFQSLTTGAVFAFLMLLLFGSGMLQGDLFPKVVWGGTFLAGLAGMFDKGDALAMLLIWCFVSGFAERLVPDILDRLTKRTASAPLFGEVKAPELATAPQEK